MPNALTLLDAYLQGWRCLSTGIPPLDSLLSGGVPTGEVMELCGTASSGKSQVALSLACRTVLGGDGGSTVLYIATTLDSHLMRAKGLLYSSIQTRVRDWQGQEEGERPPLHTLLPRASLARSFQGGLGAEYVESALREDVGKAMQLECEEAGKALRVATALDWPRLQRLLHSLERSLGGKANPPTTTTTTNSSPQAAAFLASLRLIVLDTLPTVVYPNLGEMGNHVGHVALTEIGGILHRMAHTHGLAVVVTNSTVGDRGDGVGGERRGGEGGAGGGSGGGGVGGSRPSLGLTWSFAPDLILLVSRCITVVGTIPRDTLAFTVIKSSRLYLGCAAAATASFSSSSSSSSSATSSLSAQGYVPEGIMVQQQV